MGYIYKITNQINNKVYVGQTKKTVDYRFKEHNRQAKIELKGERPLTHLHAAIIKYGFENFKVETLEQCDNNDLNEKEKYWIAYYDSYNCGYNMTQGGQGINNHVPANTKKVVQYDLNGSFITIFDSGAEASRQLKIPAQNIYLACNPNTAFKSAGGYQWKYYTSNYPQHIPSISGKAGKPGLPVNQYNINGELLCTFSSPREAAEKTGVGYRNINRSCELKGSTTAGGYLWRHVGDKPPESLLIQRLKKWCNPSVPILQLNKQGQVIKEWTSIVEAAHQLNLDAKKIGLVCEKQHKTYNNFQWQYKI